MALDRRTLIQGILFAPAGTLLNERVPTGQARIVHNGSELQAALRQARPGLCIGLAPGDFGDVPRFEIVAPDVTLRAQVPLRSVIRAPLEITGDRALLQDLAFIDPSADGLLLAAAGRCSDSVLINSSDVEVAGCDFGFFPARGILVRPTGLRPYIHHCTFHDNRNLNGGNAHEAISLGYNNSTSDTPLRARVVSNVLWNLNAETEAIAVKSSDNIIDANRLSNSRSAFSNRCGERNLYRNNSCSSAAGFFIEDRANRLLGNRIIGQGSITILGGNTPANGRYNGGDLHYQATSTYLEANNGPLVIGRNYAGTRLPAINTTVQTHIGSIRLLNQIGTRLPRPV